MKINQEVCTGCELCIEICPSGAIFQNDGRIEVNEELCLNILFCSAAYACPVQAMVRAAQAREAVRCDNCIVHCEISPGQVGECRLFRNENGTVLRIDSPVTIEAVEESVGPDYDEAIRRPLLTGIGTGMRGWWSDPLIVGEKVNGVDVVTCVSESHYLFSGLKLLLHTDRFIGDEGCKVYRNGMKVGRVTADGYGLRTMDIGGCNTFGSINGLTAMQTVVDIANQKQVSLEVEDGAKLEIQVGEKPEINGEVMERRSWGCGFEVVNTLYNDFLRGLVDDVIVFDRGITTQMGKEAKIDMGYWQPPSELHFMGLKDGSDGSRPFASGISIIRYHYGEHFGFGLGGTPVDSPEAVLDHIEFDPDHVKPGTTLLATEPSTSRAYYLVFTEEKTFKQSEMPLELKAALDDFRQSCEPANVAAFYRAGSGGTARRSLVKRGMPLKLSQAFREKKALLSVAGIPVTVFPGGGIDFMVDVQKVRPGSFFYTPAIATGAPLEWTMKREDFIAVGGNVEAVRSLKDVLEFIKQGGRLQPGRPIGKLIDELIKEEGK